MRSSQPWTLKVAPISLRKTSATSVIGVLAIHAPMRGSVAAAWAVMNPPSLTP